MTTNTDQPIPSILCPECDHNMDEAFRWSAEWDDPKWECGHDDCTCTLSPSTITRILLDRVQQSATINAMRAMKAETALTAEPTETEVVAAWNMYREISGHEPYRNAMRAALRAAREALR